MSWYHLLFLLQSIIRFLFIRDYNPKRSACVAESARLHAWLISKIDLRTPSLKPIHKQNMTPNIFKRITMLFYHGTTNVINIEISRSKLQKNPNWIVNSALMFFWRFSINFGLPYFGPFLVTSLIFTRSQFQTCLRLPGCPFEWICGLHLWITTALNARPGRIKLSPLYAKTFFISCLPEAGRSASRRCNSNQVTRNWPGQHRLEPRSDASSWTRNFWSQITHNLIKTFSLLVDYYQFRIW